MSLRRDLIAFAFGIAVYQRLRRAVFEEVDDELDTLSSPMR